MGRKFVILHGFHKQSLKTPEDEIKISTEVIVEDIEDAAFQTLIFQNELPCGKPRGIEDRSPQELRSKPRFLPFMLMKKVGQAAEYSHPANAG
jgi:hypothetical protein